MNKRWLFGLVVLSVLSLTLGACQSRPTAQEIVAKMQEVEASTTDVHGVLEFSIRAGEMDASVVVQVWEKHPNKLRVEVLESTRPEFEGLVSVTDGQQAWAYNPTENEVIVGEMGDAPATLRQMMRLMEEGIQQVLDTSEIELVGEEEVAGVPTYKLEFAPREGEQQAVLPLGSQATLWVDQERWVVLQAYFIGDFFGEAQMTVRSFELNTGLDDALFQFEVPEGAEVIQIEDRQPTSLTLDEAETQAGFDLLVPATVPGGATLVDVFNVGDLYVLYYDHGEISFTIRQGRVPDEGETPDGQTSTVTVRGQEATLIDDGLGHSFLTWTEGEVTITIAGQIGTEEVISVAESLQ